MWDEEKFFKDFVEETDKIEPDKEFVEHMISLANESTQLSFWKKYGYRVLATAAVLAVVSFAGIRFLPELMADNPAEMTPELQAQDVQTPEGVEGSSGSIGELLEPELEAVKELLGDEESVVSNESGHLSTEEKGKLLQRIRKAKRYKEKKVEGESVVYQIEGEEVYQIELIDDKYLVIEGVERIYIME